VNWGNGKAEEKKEGREYAGFPIETFGNVVSPSLRAESVHEA